MNHNTIINEYKLRKIDYYTISLSNYECHINWVEKNFELSFKLYNNILYLSFKN